MPLCRTHRLTRQNLILRAKVRLAASLDLPGSLKALLLICAFETQAIFLAFMSSTGAGTPVQSLAQRSCALS